MATRARSAPHRDVPHSAHPAGSPRSRLQQGPHSRPRTARRASLQASPACRPTSQHGPCLPGQVTTRARTLRLPHRRTGEAQPLPRSRRAIAVFTASLRRFLQVGRKPQTGTSLGPCWTDDRRGVSCNPYCIQQGVAGGIDANQGQPHDLLQSVRHPTSGARLGPKPSEARLWPPDGIPHAFKGVCASPDRVTPYPQRPIPEHRGCGCGLRAFPQGPFCLSEEPRIEVCSGLLIPALCR